MQVVHLVPASAEEEELKMIHHKNGDITFRDKEIALIRDIINDCHWTPNEVMIFLLHLFGMSESVISQKPKKGKKR